MRKEANNGEETKKAAVKLMKTIQLPENANDGIRMCVECDKN